MEADNITNGSTEKETDKFELRVKKVSEINTNVNNSTSNGTQITQDEENEAPKVDTGPLEKDEVRKRKSECKESTGTSQNDIENKRRKSEDTSECEIANNDNSTNERESEDKPERELSNDENTTSEVDLPTTINIKKEPEDKPSDKLKESDGDDNYPKPSCSGISNPVDVKPTVKVEKADASSTTSRESCTFGIKCYRRNPMHRIEQAHPGDQDYKRPDYPLPPLGTPNCPYGNKCYRRNPVHFQQFSHPIDTDFEKNYRLRKRKLQRQQLQQNFDGEDDDSDLIDSEEPFEDDSDDEYIPSDDDDYDDYRETEEFTEDYDDCDKAEE